MNHRLRAALVVALALATSPLEAGCHASFPPPASPPSAGAARPGAASSAPAAASSAPAASAPPAGSVPPPAATPQSDDPFAEACAVLMKEACDPGPCSCSTVATDKDAFVVARTTGELTRYVPVLRTPGGVQLGDRSIEIIASDTAMCKTAVNHVTGVTLTRGDRAVDMAVAVSYDVTSNCPETGVPQGKAMSRGNRRKEALRCTPSGATFACKTVEPDQP
jgi:hypothetical protein